MRQTVDEQILTETGGFPVASALWGLALWVLRKKHRS